MKRRVQLPVPPGYERAVLNPAACPDLADDYERYKRRRMERYRRVLRRDDGLRELRGEESDLEASIERKRERVEVIDRKVLAMFEHVEPDERQRLLMWVQANGAEAEFDATKPPNGETVTLGAPGVVEEAPEGFQRIVRRKLDERLMLEEEVQQARFHLALLRAVKDEYTHGDFREEPPADLSFATQGQRRHLRRAHLLLDFYDDEIGTRNDFIDKAAEMEFPDELGRASGGAIWRGVTRLGKVACDVPHMPDRYTRFDGFMRLVRDLRSGALSPPG